MQLETLASGDTQCSVRLPVANVEMCQKLTGRNFSTRNARSHHENILFALRRSIVVLGLTHVTIVLLVNPVVFDEMFGVLAKFMIVSQLFGESPTQLMARLFDNFDGGTLRIF